MPEMTLTIHWTVRDRLSENLSLPLVLTWSVNPILHVLRRKSKAQFYQQPGCGPKKQAFAKIEVDPSINKRRHLIRIITNNMSFEGHDSIICDHCFATDIELLNVCA